MGGLVHVEGAGFWFLKKEAERTGNGDIAREHIWIAGASGEL